MFCKDCGDYVRVELHIKNLKISSFNEDGSFNVDIVQVIRNITTAEIKINGHENHTLRERCTECGKPLLFTVNDGKIISSDNNSVLVNGGYYVCRDCYDRFYKNVEFNEEFEEED